MAVDTSAFIAALDAAKTAAAAGDWTTARQKAVEAQIALAALPDTTFGDVRIQFRANELKQLVDTINRESAAATGGMRLTKVRYARPGP